MTKGAFPAPTNLPAFVSASAPQGTVTTSDQGGTIDVPCTVNLPFQVSAADARYYYYLHTDKSENSIMLSSGSGSTVKYRSLGQNATLNDVVNDLWYVTGNPFDGFKFYNVGKGDDLRSTAVVVEDNSSIFGNVCELGFGSMASQTTVWDLGKSENGNEQAFIIYPHNGNTWNCARYDGSTVHFNYNADSGHTGDFVLTDPTITLPLNYSAADDARFATTCLPYAVEVADADGTVKTYAGKLNDDNTELDMVAVSSVPANQGIIIKGNSNDESVTLRVLGTAADITNDLKGTTSELTDLTGVLSFGRANGTGNVGFFRSTNATLKANRAYVKLDTESQNSIAMRFDGQATSIDQVNKGAESISSHAPIYDLSGRQVSHLVKGSLYIQGGRKFIAQ